MISTQRFKAARLTYGRAADRIAATTSQLHALTCTCYLPSREGNARKLTHLRSRGIVTLLRAGTAVPSLLRVSAIASVRTSTVLGLLPVRVIRIDHYTGERMMTRTRMGQDEMDTVI